MKEQFISYAQALKLKELGFNEQCFYIFDNQRQNKLLPIYGLFDNDEPDRLINAPLWQQAFDWFREKYKLHGWVVPYFTLVGINYSYLIMDEKMRNLEDEVDVGTYQEARQACLEKLIEIVENENRTR